MKLAVTKLVITGLKPKPAIRPTISVMIEASSGFSP